MKKYMNELVDPVCTICGEHIGMGFDHTECSLAKKEMYGDSNENKKPKKNQNRKAIDNQGKYLSKL